MKKALQVTHFRADLSLPDRAAGSGPREACARSFFHCFAKFLGVDLRRPAARLLDVLGRGVRKRFVGTLRGRRRGLRERPRGEPQAARSSLPESLFQAREDLALELAELEGPGRGARRNVQRAVPGEARGPRVRGNGIADCPGPGRDEVRHRSGRAETAELASYCAPDPLHHETSARLVPSRSCSTAMVCAGSPGRAFRLALVTSAWPVACRRSTKMRR